MRRRGPRPRRIAYAGFCRGGTTVGRGRPRTAAQDRVRGISPLRDDRGGTRISRQSWPADAQDCGWSIAVAGALSGAGAVGGAGAVSVAARIRKWGWSRPRVGARDQAGNGTTAGGGKDLASRRATVAQERRDGAASARLRYLATMHTMNNTSTCVKQKCPVT